MSILRYVVCLALAAIVGGCANQPASTPGGGSSPPSPISFDGRYVGSVQVAGVAGGVDPRQCATDPRLSLQVTNNTFSYAQSHPDVANKANTPTYDEKAMTPVYTATIAPNGLITGSSGDVGGTIEGTVSAAHMSGTITGLLCSYKFTADRI